MKPSKANKTATEKRYHNVGERDGDMGAHTHPNRYKNGEQIELNGADVAVLVCVKYRLDINRVPSATEKRLTYLHRLGLISIDPDARERIREKQSDAPASCWTMHVGTSDFLKSEFGI